MPLVSIVVPVYKVEKYLDRCVKSLVNQTLKDIEIILVDDGSPDRCPELCDGFSRKDRRIRVVHKRNGGLSSARNAGIALASGKYIGFVDSDDDVEPDMYSKMVEAIAREKVDFVMSDYIRVMHDGRAYLKSLEIASGRYDKEKIRTNVFPQLIMGENLEYGPLLSVWHCLYDAKFLNINHLHFDEQVKWSEDNIFSAIAGYLADSFFYMKGEGLYHYYQNEGTITTGYRKNAWPVYRIMNEHLHQFFDSVKDYDFSNQLKLHLIFYACNSLGQICLASEKQNKQIAAIRTIMDDPQLEAAFQNFTFPKSWSNKLKIQVELIKRKKATMYYLFILHRR
ncbi:MAG: glycosyltransferase family 2 protein [Lachnospiraceae bacterium]|nr:glycosyltransferase family 2 protein [Lachnospiraceae bacterium]